MSATRMAPLAALFCLTCIAQARPLRDDHQPIALAPGSVEVSFARGLVPLHGATDLAVMNATAFSPKSAAEVRVVITPDSVRVNLTAPGSVVSFQANKPSAVNTHGSNSNSIDRKPCPSWGFGPYCPEDRHTDEVNATMDHA